MLGELKRIIEESEVIKYVPPDSKGLPAYMCVSFLNTHIYPRENDGLWPKKNAVGRQELEIRIGNEHALFEVPPVGLVLVFGVDLQRALL